MEEKLEFDVNDKLSGQLDLSKVDPRQLQIITAHYGMSASELQGLIDQGEIFVDNVKNHKITSKKTTNHSKSTELKNSSNVNINKEDNFDRLKAAVKIDPSRSIPLPKTTNKTEDNFERLKAEVKIDASTPINTTKSKASAPVPDKKDTFSSECSYCGNAMTGMLNNNMQSAQCDKCGTSRVFRNTNNSNVDCPVCSKSFVAKIDLSQETSPVSECPSCKHRFLFEFNKQGAESDRKTMMKKKSDIILECIH